MWLFQRNLKIKNVHVEFFCPLTLIYFVLLQIDSLFFLVFLFFLFLLFDFGRLRHHLGNISWIGKMTILLNNSFNCGVLLHHFLMMASALLGTFCEDIVLHQCIHPQLLFLLKRQVKNFSLFNEKIYVLFLLYKGPVISRVRDDVFESSFIAFSLFG